MKVYDCFLYCNEDVILDARLNILNKYVDKFIIVESKFYHNGKNKGFNFNVKKYLKFKKKIIYIRVNKKPDNLENIVKSKKKIDTKILNAIKFENYQRNKIQDGLDKCTDEDIIILSDIDEIPNLKYFNFNKVKNEVFFFSQKFFYYKFNLYDPSQKWLGSRIIKFKNLKSPQWLRNLKVKKYPRWRIDKIFDKKIYKNFQIIKKGGWHFSFLNNPKGILNKTQTYLHHVDFENSNLSKKDILKFVKHRNPIYNLNTDQRSNKLSSKTILKKINNKFLPHYIVNNKKKFKNWLI